jgi:hypothetical protein
MFTQICSKKKRREGKWTEDEDNDLYFAWHDQKLVGDTSHRKSWKQFWEEVHANFNQRTSGDDRSLPSITNRW